MSQVGQTVTLGGARVGCRCHACAFVRGRDEEYDVLLPFMREGFERGDHMLHLLDAGRRQERRERLAGEGLAVHAAERSGRLELQTWEEAYLADGRFDQHATVARVEEASRAGTAAEGGVMRIWADMEWALSGAPGVGDLVAYEARVNLTLSRFDVAAVCVYDLSCFSTSTILDVLRAHPQVILDGVLRENPFYTPPEELLPELAQRAAGWN